jgi:alpha-methylacyl-CoA racemase
MTQQSDTSRLNTFLEGVRILDLSCYLPGPLATMLLSDMGAEVVKIEPPRGDEQRRIGPKGPDGQSIFFHAVNAGKTTRTIDLKTDAGQAVLYELVKKSDVFIESFRPGVVERLRIDYPILKGLNKGLIYCSLSGFGQSGPFANVTGHDANFLALSGIMHRNAQKKPSFYDPPIADCAGSLFAMVAILGALKGRERDGAGCHIDLSLADAPMALQMFRLAQLGVSGAVPRPLGEYLNGGAAYYQVYETGDRRHVMLGAIEDKFWAAFCEASGRPDWIGRHHDPEPQKQLIDELAALFRTWTLEECQQRFEGVDCGLSPVLDLVEAVAHPHHVRRGLLTLRPVTGYQALFPALIDGKPPSPRPVVRSVEAESH